MTVGHEAHAARLMCDSLYASAPHVSHDSSQKVGSLPDGLPILTRRHEGGASWHMDVTVN
jgi:hypothetical protein